MYVPLLVPLDFALVGDHQPLISTCCVHFEPCREEAGFPLTLNKSSPKIDAQVGIGRQEIDCLEKSTFESTEVAFSYRNKEGKKSTSSDL